MSTFDEWLQNRLIMAKAEADGLRSIRAAAGELVMAIAKLEAIEEVVTAWRELHGQS